MHPTSVRGGSKVVQLLGRLRGSWRDHGVPLRRIARRVKRELSIVAYRTRNAWAARPEPPRVVASPLPENLQSDAVPFRVVSAAARLQEIDTPGGATKLAVQRERIYASHNVVRATVQVVDADGMAKGTFYATGNTPVFCERLNERGIELPDKLFEQRVLGVAQGNGSKAREVLS